MALRSDLCPRRTRLALASLLVAGACGGNSPAPAPKDSSTTTAPTTWWCACYARNDPTPVPATACRKGQDDCARLERKAREGGGNSIVARSLTHTCREIAAEHPGDLLGGRDVWQAGDRPGNYVSTGRCLLPGPPDVTAAPRAASTRPPSILDDERLGELTIGLADATTLKILGAPARRTAAELSAKTGRHRSSWHYPDQGLELIFEAADKPGPYELAELRALAPCTLRTARGVGIGDDYATVKSTYLKDRDPTVESDDGTFIAGTLTSGAVIFRFDPTTRGVKEIFLGVAETPP